MLKLRGCLLFVNGIIEEPQIVWHQNIRFNNINGVKFADTFIFLAHEFVDKSLIRNIYLTTNDYYIRLMITIHTDTSNLTENKIMIENLFENIYNETPEYFEIFSDRGIDLGRPIIIWNRNTRGNIRFGDDLLSGQNQSETANSWFRKTEEVLNLMQFR